VVAGCGDGQAAGLGAGATRTDEAYLNLGTAVVAGVHSGIYRHGAVYRTDAAGLPGQYVLEVVQNSGAYLAGWFRSELGDPDLRGAPDPGLEAAAATVPTGCGGLVALPYWNAVQSPYWDPIARGAFVGLSGIHGRAHLYRALLEGISLETARNLRGLQADTGVALTSVRVMGGGQRSDLWRHIVADATGLPLTSCEDDEVSAMGAAAQAIAYVTGQPIADTARRLAKLGAITEPDDRAHAVYSELGAIQEGMYEALSPTFAAQHTFAARHPL
jgi:xylulokinase